MSQTFVLVHGAWHGGWAWRPVRVELTAAGHRVTAPTTAGLGVDDDPTGVTLQQCVDSLVRHVEDRDLRDVVLVGHSWGGFVIGGAAPRLADRLKRLVFFSAFVPQVGESLYDLVPPDYQGLFQQLADASPTNSISMPLEVFQGGFMADATAEQSALVHGLLQPQPYRTFRDPLTPEMDFYGVDVPKTYLLATEDVALPPGEFAWAPRFPERLGGSAAETPGSHEAMFTRPVELAQALAAIAAS